MHRTNLAITGSTGPVQSTLSDDSPICNVLMLIPTKPVCPKVGITNLVLSGVLDQRLHSQPRLKRDLEHTVHVLIPECQVQELRSFPLRHAGHPAHLLSCKIPRCTLVLDDCALALRDEPLTDIPVINCKRLDLGMSPVEADKPNDMDILITLLKSLLKPGNLSRLSCGICHFLHDVIALQAMLLDVLIKVGHVDVAPELVLRVILIGVPVLSIASLIKSPEHDGQGGVLQRSCNLHWLPVRKYL